MKAKQFIENYLEKLVEKFPLVKAIYEFDNCSECHFIEIVPEIERYSNLELKEFERELYLKFLSFYSEEIISIVGQGEYDFEHPQIFEKVEDCSIIFSKPVNMYSCLIFNGNLNYYIKPDVTFLNDDLGDYFTELPNRMHIKSNKCVNLFKVGHFNIESTIKAKKNNKSSIPTQITSPYIVH